jgi:glycosyltransferase involved in cell wall biosynthesis
VLLFVGQLVRGKGLDCLLRALTLVRAPWRLEVVGEGSHRAYCEALTDRLGLRPRVRFHGFVSPAELERFYDQALCFVMPSVWPEPSGLAGLEAMRRGLAVVGFDAGGIGEWLIEGTSGHLVPWMDLRTMAARLDGLLANPAEALRLGRSAQELAATRFSFDPYLRALSEFLGRLSTRARPA